MELAASIKENGIFQNLTVIPGHYLNSREYIAKCVDEGGDAAAAAAAWTPKAVWSSEDYTIIIGHRRAAAAQQAGLFEVPCVVVEMDEREQLQTMMIENMQRSDLTTYEQAQGFQLMLDLGDTVEQVASKSGFSQSTIRRRVKLLSLDRDAFRRAELRGATLSDYAELDKIESVEDKNKALEALGTQNFRRVMQEVLENQKWEHRKAEWIADLKKFAIEDPNATYQTHEHVTGYSKWNITKDVVVPEDADHVQYFYKVSSGQIDLYKTRDVAAEDAEKAKRDAAREEERMIGESFHNITELMFNLRREFVVELAPTDCKKGFPAIARYMACAADDNFDLDLTLIGNILGVELSQEFVNSSGKDWYKILDEDGVYGTMPEKVLLALAYSSMDSSYCGYWSKDWNVERQKYVYSYRENPTLDATYEMLTALGYEISDDEQALRDGTHKIFREYGSDEKKWSECDYCKAAHPNCNKTYTAGSKASAIVKDLLNIFGLEVGTMELAVDKEYPRGKVCKGKVKNVLTEIVTSDCKSRFLIRNGIVTINDPKTGTKTGYVLSAESGLLQATEATDRTETTTRQTTVKDGKEKQEVTYKRECLLNYHLAPADVVKIKSDTLNGNHLIKGGQHTGCPDGDWKTTIEVKPV